MSKKQQAVYERRRKELEDTLNETLEKTIREAALPNSIAWLGVVIGSFALNLLLLVIVSGG